MTDALPAHMTAVEIAEPGGPEVLRPAQRDVPVPGAGEVLIRVAAAGVNAPDLKQRRGAYPPPPGASDLPGLEVAGTVVALGQGARGWRIGDAVCALTNGGGYAEYCVAPAGQTLPIPDGLSPIEAASLPETYFTVWMNVFMLAGMQPGERLLVHGGAGGIGSTAIQLGKAFGATVFATASAAKCGFCRELGADRAIDYESEDFLAVIRDEAPGGAVDIVLDQIGGDYFPRNVKALAADGRLAQIAFDKGLKAEINLAAVMRDRLTIRGSTLRPRSAEYKAAIAAELRERVWPKLADGTLRPVIDRTFPLAEAAKAHALMEAKGHLGKLVLEI